jgi:hypothetical protein
MKGLGFNPQHCKIKKKKMKKAPMTAIRKILKRTYHSFVIFYICEVGRTK